MKNQKVKIAYVVGILIACIWGSTFISSKVLLGYLEPIEILLYRFLIGYLTLTVIKPKPMPFLGWVKEFWCFAAGALSVTIYFMCESSALKYTNAGNVGIIIALVPIFTALLSFIFIKEEKPSYWYYIGFVIAISGIVLINWEQVKVFHFDARGYILAIAAAFSWAMFSTVTKAKIYLQGYLLESTKRILFYGIISSIPLLIVFDVSLEFSKLGNTTVIGNLLFLGVLASGLAYLAWNWMISVLGAVKATVFIYINPVVTFIVAFLILGEAITLHTVFGATLVITGLILSEKRKKSKDVDIIKSEKVIDT